MFGMRVHKHYQCLVDLKARIFLSKGHQALKVEDEKEACIWIKPFADLTPENQLATHKKREAIQRTEAMLKRHLAQ